VRENNVVFEMYVDVIYRVKVIFYFENNNSLYYDYMEVARKAYKRHKFFSGLGQFVNRKETTPFVELTDPQHIKLSWTTLAIQFLLSLGNPLLNY